MKRIFQISLLFLFAATAAAQESSAHSPPKVLRVYDWKDLSAQFTNSQIISMDGMFVLKIENTNDKPLRVLLLTITNSPLIQKANTIEWEMKYENVCLLDGFRLPPMMIFFTSTEDGLLGMGNTRLTNYPNVCFFEKFPPQVAGGDNFTNYQGDFLNGTKNWGKFSFQIRPVRYDNETRPDELELKLSLPSSGTVYLRPIKLLKTAGSPNWWSPERAGMIGGIGGAIIGCLGGLIGLLAGKGKARNFVLTTIKIFIMLGILSLITGVIAIASGQPYAVWYPSLLLGFILTTVFSVNLPSIQRRYDELEIRRMASVDVMRS